MAALPTRIKQNIRDHVSSETSPLAVRTKALTATLGYPIKLDPEWTMLWKTLQAYFPDSSTFVPSIASTVTTWCDAFTSWIETEENEEQVDKLLDALKAWTRLEIILEVSSTASTRPTTAWSANKPVFVIALPKHQFPPQHTTLAGFSTDLLALFSASPIISTADKHASTKSGIPDDPEDWADLDLGTPESHPVPPPRSPHRKGSKDVGDDPLPEVSTIQRPEELTRKPPYWMVVSQERRQLVVVRCSHAPSLACLDEYLRRWCRGEVSRVNRPPVVEIKLHESAFGLGLLHDTLTLEAIRGREVSAMLILSFVEGILGYSPVPSSGSAGSVWEFRRTKGFR